MEGFYKLTILVATGFLILALTVIGILLSRKSNNLVWPPVAMQCPDYWTSDGSGNCIAPNKDCVPGPASAGCNFSKGQPLNGFASTKLIQDTPGISTVKNRDNTNTTLINFSDPGWKGVCAKQQWAKNNNIVWDGISNYNSC